MPEPIVTPGETPAPKTETVEGNDPEPKGLTPDELRAENEKLAKALKEANKEAAGRRKRLEELEKSEQERLEASKTELQKAQDRAAQLEAETKNLRLSVLRRDVAAKTGLPEALIDRLKGETLEEVEADAKALLESLPKEVKKPAINATNPAGGSINETAAQRKERLRGQSHNSLDPAWAKAHGGGVVGPAREE